jgi:hypothetical protein
MTINNGLTEIIIPATITTKTGFNKHNQRIKFAYDDLCKGICVGMFLVDGVIDAPESQVVIDIKELEKVLEFLRNGKE